MTKSEEIEQGKQAIDEWLVNCALEGIVPDDNTRKELELLREGIMSPKEFEDYIFAKYT